MEVANIQNMLQSVPSDGHYTHQHTKHPFIIALELDEFNECPGRIEVPVMLEGVDLCHTPASKLKRTSSLDGDAIQIPSPSTVIEDQDWSRDTTLSEPNSATSSSVDQDFAVTSRQSSNSDLGVRISPRMSPRDTVSAEVMLREYQQVCERMVNFDAIKQHTLPHIRVQVPHQHMHRELDVCPAAPMAASNPPPSAQVFKQTPEEAQRTQAEAREAMKPLRMHTRALSWHQGFAATRNPCDIGHGSGHTGISSRTLQELNSIKPSRSPPMRPSKPSSSLATDCLVMIPGMVCRRWQ